MIDIQYIRENPDLVAQKAAQKGYPVDISHLLELDKIRRDKLTYIESELASRNVHSKWLGKEGGPSSEENREKGRRIKENVARARAELEPIEVEYQEMLRAVPNMPLADVPVGASEDENVVVKTVGAPPEFDFTPRHDYQLGELHDLIDKERAAKIAGSRFAYLKGDLVRLQFALIQFVMGELTNEQLIKKLVDENNLNISTKPFTPVLPPAMLRTEPYRASARLNAEEVTYKIEQDDLWLQASAEHTLCTMYWNEILPEDMFPIRYLGYATSFRREAGTYGKDEEGIFRMHQFDKLEMESFTTPETGLAEHKLHIAIQEHLMQKLGLPYQLLQKCTADIGKPNAAGVDINCWFPGQGKYRETHTADYMTDYQARDLKIRIRRKKRPVSEFAAATGQETAYSGGGDVQLVHTADATAFAMSRTLKAILENFQTRDGHIIVPEILRPFMGGQLQI
ncbi:MAG TPA: serine--tRNA ligase [Candidatus Saccharimonadales bacterium]|nr:serine--tRNA ligase [Candidatus Saccharimonadales bacterium]